MEMDARSEPEPEIDRLRHEARELEEALGKARQSERILDQITRTVKDFVIVLLTPDGRVLLWNEGAERMLGYDAGEIHGQSAAILFAPEDVEKGLPAKELATARAEGRAEDENWLRRKDGSLFWASGVTSAIRGASGELEGFVKILRDRSDRKRLEEELRRLNATLEQRVKDRTEDLEDALKEMGAFSYSIAHDLRAPLRAMSGFADVLEEDFREALGEEGLQHLRRIQDSARFMNQMIEDLLTYSRLTRAEVLCHPLDPDPVLDLVLRNMAVEIAETGAEIVVDRPLPRLMAHELTLGQVFTNLLSNALKFVGPGVRPRVRVWGEAREGWIRIWFEDNGVGVAPGQSRRIFGIFERLHTAAEFPGTGIGLAIVNRAVERMKGRVGVEPGPGGGSRFWVDLRPILPGP